MIHNNVFLLKQALMKQAFMQQIQFGDQIRQLAEGVPGREEKALMIETRLYVGLNDAETKQQLFETEQYTAQLKQLCSAYHVPFSVGIEEGGYYHENGEYVEEKTLVLTLIGVGKETILKIAKGLQTMFHQESILVTEEPVKGTYIV